MPVQPEDSLPTVFGHDMSDTLFTHCYPPVLELDSVSLV